MCFLLCNVFPSYIKLIGQLLSASNFPAGGELCDEKNTLDLNVYMYDSTDFIWTFPKLIVSLMLQDRPIISMKHLCKSCMNFHIVPRYHGI